MTGKPVIGTPDRSVDGGPGQFTGVRERTPWLLAFLCIWIPILPWTAVPAGPLKSNGSPAKLIALVFFALIVLGFIMIHRTAKIRAVRPGVVLILLYFFLQLLVYGVGITRIRSELADATATRYVIVLLANTGVALYAMTRVETTRQRSIVLGCLAIGLTFACAVGLLQSTAGVDLRFMFKPPGFVENTEFVGFADRGGAKRVVGTSQHAIEFSVLAAVTVPLTIHFARFAGNRRVRVLAILACGLALAAMPAAIARTGVVALAAALLVYMWSFTVRRLASGVLTASVAVTGYLMTSPTTANALWQTIVTSEEDPSVLERTADYAVVSETFRAHPVFGLGLGGNPWEEYGFLDNEWLQAIVQGGSVGVVAMMVLTGGIIFGLSAGLRRVTSPRERDQTYMLASMLVGIMVSSFTFDLFTYQQATLIFFILFGLLWSTFSIGFPDTRHNDAENRTLRHLRTGGEPRAT
jgi:O-antigen ligase